MRHEINSWIDALVPSLLGLLIVFFVLALIMAVIYIMAACFKNTKPEQIPQPKPETPAVIEPIEKPRKIPAAGSLGEIKLYNTPDKSAAMVMAIVADNLKKPLNEIRFISIRRIDN